MVHFKKETFFKAFLDQCKGENICPATFTIDQISDLPPSLQKANVMLFVQVQCTQDPDKITAKNIMGLVVALFGVCISLSFMLTLSSTYRLDLIKNVEHDIANRSIDDYSAQALLPQGLYAEFLEKECSNLHGS